MTRKIKRYGWIPDLPDQRDFMYAAPLAALRALPPKKDLTGQCPPVYDQGELGSPACAGQTGARRTPSAALTSLNRGSSLPRSELVLLRGTRRRQSRLRACSSTTTNGPLKARSTKIPGP